MIPKKIHYCWFGKKPLPELALECIESWHKHMPDWEYTLWNESNFDIGFNNYCKEAYDAGKFAFVSDIARLVALKNVGGLYLDVDFKVFKSFEGLLGYKAFAGFEGSKYSPVMMGVCASEPNGEWVSEALKAYDNRHFIKPDGGVDLTTNVAFITQIMASNGFRQDGTEQDYLDCHIFPVDYFCPRHTTGEYIRTKNTYCEHKGLGSWNGSAGNWKVKLLNHFGQNNRTRLIKIKRALLG